MMCRFWNLLHFSLSDVTYAARMRVFLLVGLVALIGCNGKIFTRDGVTDGDTFYLAPAAFDNRSPEYQSWVAYSLMKSACQLRIGGENPARASSFVCECTARRHLVDTWVEKHLDDQHLTDEYLDDLRRVADAGFLREYTARYFSRSGWVFPTDLEMDAFRSWQRQHFRHHRPETRLTGSWGFNGKPVPQRRIVPPES